MEKINLVVVPFHDWKKCEREGFRTRDAHFMKEFGKHPMVEKLLIINRPISISEIILLRRNWHVKYGELLLHESGFYLTRVAENTFTLDIVIPQFIRPIKMRRHWTPYIFGRKDVAAIVNHVLQLLQMQERYAFFACQPLFSTLVKNLSPKLFILDALDNLLKHPLYRDTPGLNEYYDYCLEHAGLIYANSSETTGWLNEKRPDAKYIPNGVDVEHFNSSNNYPCPPDLALIKPPIVGYAGKMQELFDVNLLLTVADSLPEVSFVCIGQLLNPKWVKLLWSRQNIHYLGDKHYNTLPQYLASFDICMIPADISRQHGGDPIKFYEYLAMGKPIVTTNIGGVTAFAHLPQVKVVANAVEFIDALNHFLAFIKSGVQFPAVDLPNDVLWSTKVDMMINAIQQKMSTK